MSEGVLATASRVRTGDTSATALAEASIARVREQDQRLNAICAVCPDDSVEAGLDQAPTGLLAGIPVAVKDQFALPWWAPRDATPPEAVVSRPGESAVYQRLRQAGALPLLVANMHQLAMGMSGEVSAYGRCANPWGEDRWAGGSSSGSAVAVAAGYVPLAVGTDGGGSIRIPAAWCGVTGLKTTWGSVPSAGYTSAGSSMAAIGPIARDAADCRTGAEALLRRSLVAASPRALRVGVLRGDEWANVNEAVAARFDDAIRLFRHAGAEVVEVEIAGAGHIPLATAVVMGVDRIGGLSPEWARVVLPALDRSIQRLLKARFRLQADVAARVLRLRSLLRAELARAFASVDVIAAPTVPVGAPRASDPKVLLPAGRMSPDLPTLQLNGLANLTGIPAISSPIGLDQDGMPLGMTLHAPWHEEALLLAVAELYEQASERRHLSGPGDHRPVNPPKEEVRHDGI